jgi:hypothetical protein
VSSFATACTNSKLASDGDTDRDGRSTAGDSMKLSDDEADAGGVASVARSAGGCDDNGGCCQLPLNSGAALLGASLVLVFTQVTGGDAVDGG